MHAFLINVADFDHKLSCGGVSPESLTLRIALESSGSGQQSTLEPVYSGHITAAVVGMKNVKEIAVAK